MVTFWIIAWKSVLILTLVAFAGMTVRVTIGGAADIRDLLQRLGTGDDDSDRL